jgi:hypothetical protein
MDSHMFDDLFGQLVLIGILIGLFFCGCVIGLEHCVIYLHHHIHWVK